MTTVEGKSNNERSNGSTSLAEMLRRSVWASNGSFAPYTGVPPDNDGESSTVAFLYDEWNWTMLSILSVNKDPDIRNGTSDNVIVNVNNNDRWTSLSRTWWDALWKRHTEPTRHYHTVVHLEEMLRYLRIIICTKEKEGDCFYKNNYSNTKNLYEAAVETTTPPVEHEQRQNQSLLSVWDTITIRLAIFFHDAVYDPTSATNEEDSAALFSQFYQQVRNELNDNNNINGVVVVDDGKKNNEWDPCGTSCNTAMETFVVQFILATKTHQIAHSTGSASHHRALTLFLDLDMAVLGKQEDAYWQYAALIRREYRFVPHLDYCTKRAEILEVMLQNPIYHSPALLETWEDRARTNLGNEIRMLRENKIPGTPSILPETPKND